MNLLKVRQKGIVKEKSPNPRFTVFELDKHEIKRLVLLQSWLSCAPRLPSQLAALLVPLSPSHAYRDYYSLGKTKINDANLAFSMLLRNVFT